MVSPHPVSLPPARRASWESEPHSCPVVALGASAGGFPAVSTFLGHLPPDPGLAFVLVQHLDPHHQSPLAPLGKITKMKVVEFKNGAR